MKPATKLKESKCDVMHAPAGLKFGDAVGRVQDSIYKRKVREALATDGVIRILPQDSYMRSQIRQAAKKLNCKIVYAQDAQFHYLKPIALGEEQKRLMLLLRDPRTVNELKGRGLELNLEEALKQLAGQGLAHVMTAGMNKGRWVLTEQGMDAIAK